MTDMAGSVGIRGEDGGQIAIAFVVPRVSELRAGSYSVAVRA
ncbi:hypothetical protein [Rhizobium mesosinicum]|nr:hypothetical protein [Rhizobium mesosinicum]